LLARQLVYCCRHVGCFDVHIFAGDIS